MPKLPDDEFDDLLGELMTWENDLRPLRTAWDSYWEKWELTPPADSENPFISRFQAPYPFSHVESILPRIVGADPTIDYIAIDMEEDDAAARMLSAVVGWQMQQMGFEHEIRTYIRQGLMLGYSVAKVGWTRETMDVTSEVIREVFREDTLQSYDVRTTEDVEMVVRNQAFFETIDVYDFVWPIRSISLNKAPAVWQRCWTSIDDLHDNPYYSDVDKVSAGATGDRQREKEHLYKFDGIQPSTLIEESDKGEVELWERWEDDHLTVIANRDVVIRDDPNPFVHQMKPFVDYAPIERPFRMDGVGIIKVIWDMNEDIGAMKRQRRDAVTYLINPTWKGTEGIDEDEVVLSPGGFIKVPDTDDIQPMTIPQVDIGASFQEEAQAKEDMQLVTGAYDYFSGLNPQGDQTATGVATITQEANKRIAEMIKVFDERTMKRFGVLMGRLCVQYLDEGVAVPLWKFPDAQEAWQELEQQAAPRIVKITEQDITTAGRVMPLPRVGQDKQLNDVQKKSDALQTTQAVLPIFQLGVINPQEYLNWFFTQMGMDAYARAKVISQGQPATPGSDGGQSLPTGGVVGAPAVSGALGPANMAGAQQQ